MKKPCDKTPHGLPKNKAKLWESTKNRAPAAAGALKAVSAYQKSLAEFRRRSGENK